MKLQEGKESPTVPNLHVVKQKVPAGKLIILFLWFGGEKYFLAYGQSL